MITTRRFLASMLAGLASLFFWRRSEPAAIEVPIPAKSGKEFMRQALEEESPRAAGQIAQQIRDSSPWFRLIRQGQWPKDEGYVPPAQIVNRSEGDPSWTALVDGVDSEVPWGFTKRSCNLQTTGIQSPPICLENLHAQYDCAKQINLRIEILGENAKTAWIERRRSEFDRLCDIREGTPESPVDPSRISEMLAAIERNGAAKSGVVTIVGGEHVLARLAYGVPMEVDEFPVRYKNGVRVTPFLDEKLTAERDGDRCVLKRTLAVNPDYEAADAEAIYLVHPEVYHQLNPDPELIFGKFKYNAENYIGESHWDDAYDAVHNPWQSVGKWVLRMSSASRPMMTKFGGVIIVRRQA